MASKKNQAAGIPAPVTTAALAPAGAATLIDVARVAGVSPITV